MAREPPVKWIKLRIIFSTIGVLVGISVFFAFTIHFKNYSVGGWGLLSGLVAAATLVLHISYRRHVWEENRHRLRYVMLGGCFSQLAGVCGFVTYLSLAITQNQDLSTVYGEVYYITIVWCFMTWKWGFALFYYARSYRDLYQSFCLSGK